jgi:hypothetical protein
MGLNYTPEDIAIRKQMRTWLEQNLPKKGAAMAAAHSRSTS